MTTEPKEPKLSEAEDLRQNWNAFCDADPFEGSDTFIERMEAVGFIRIRSVTKRDIADDPFAAERGIVLGGMLWELTASGRALLAKEKGL